MSGLTSEGLVIETQEQIETAIGADHRANVSATIDLSPSSPDGQRTNIIARAIAIAWEALEGVYAAIDPDSAEADALDRVAALTGSTREAATFSRAVVDCDLDAGTYAIGTLVVHVDGDPERRFANIEEVISAGGANDVLMDAEDAGPVPAPAGTLTEIASPVSGFNTATNDADAVLGLDVETDPAFRVRRALEVQAPGSASVNGIVGRVLRDNPLVLTAYAIENDTDATVDTVPPHSVEVVAFGPTSPSADDNQAVAESIFASKAGGIRAHGSSTLTVLDDFGFGHTVKLTRPSEQATDVAVTLVYNAATYPGDGAVETAVAALSPLLPGLDVAWAAIVVAVMSVPGVLRITDVELDALGSFVNKTITARQFASISSGDVTVTSSAGTP